MKTLFGNTSYIICLVFSASIFLSSCNNGSERYRNEIAMLDSLVLALEKAEGQFKSIDSEKVVKTYSALNELLEQTGELIKDTLKKEEAVLLSDFRSIRKPLKEYKSRVTILKTEIGVTKDQLSHLSHDLRKGLMKEEDVDKNVQSEVTLAKTLLSSITIMASIIPQQLSKYDSLQPLVLNFVKTKQESNTMKPPGT
jgi:hypothetical protein